VNLPEDVQGLFSNKLVIKNAGGQAVEGQFNGTIYKLAPGQEKTIRDVTDFKKVNGKRQPDLPLEVIGTALQVVSHLFDKCQFGDRGVYVKTGDPRRDEEEERKAFERYRKYRVGWALRKQQDWLTRVETARRASLLPPVQPPDVEEEIAFLNQHKQAVLRSERKRYICKIDSYQSDNLEEIRSYINQNYADRLERMGSDVDAQIYDLDDVAIPKQEKQEKDDSDLGAELLDKAESLGINLKKDHLRGLMKKDKATIAEVQKLLAEKATSQ
jgi:hypothetical protein